MSSAQQTARLDEGLQSLPSEVQQLILQQSGAPSAAAAAARAASKSLKVLFDSCNTSLALHKRPSLATSKGVGQAVAGMVRRTPRLEDLSICFDETDLTAVLHALAQAFAQGPSAVTGKGKGKGKGKSMHENTCARVRALAVAGNRRGGCRRQEQPVSTVALGKLLAAPRMQSLASVTLRNLVFGEGWSRLELCVPAISALAGLRSLSIDGCYMGLSAATALERCLEALAPHLTSLTLKRFSCHMDNDTKNALSRGVRASTGLRKLDLDDNHRKTNIGGPWPGNAALFTLPQTLAALTGLQDLALRPWSDARTLRELPDLLASLTRIDLGIGLYRTHSPPQEEAEALATLASMTNLRHLDATGFFLDTSNAPLLLPAVAQLHALTSLRLDNVRCCCRGVPRSKLNTLTDLTLLTTLTQLQHISLADNGMDDRDVGALSDASKHWPDVPRRERTWEL
jgi:hypothetical protein